MNYAKNMETKEIDDLTGLYACLARLKLKIKSIFNHTGNGEQFIFFTDGTHLRTRKIKLNDAYNKTNIF